MRPSACFLRLGFDLGRLGAKDFALQAGEQVRVVSDHSPLPFACETDALLLDASLIFLARGSFPSNSGKRWTGGFPVSRFNVLTIFLGLEIKTFLLGSGRHYNQTMAADIATKAQ
jgi:hypothetical protein